MGTLRKLLAVALLVGGITSLGAGVGYLAISIENQPPAQQPTNSSAVPPAVQNIHESGLTGENVSVGVLDVTDFDTDQQLLADRVVETAHFGEGSGGSRTSHGTKAAVTVARLAPDADLYLSSFESAEDYTAGLKWLIEQDVDVIVTPVAYAGTLGDGTSRMARATTNATESGVTVVAPAGNLGASHWLGEYNPTSDGIHVFGDGILNEIAGPSGRGEFWLVTDDTTGEYRLELHKLGDDNETELVARSVPYRSGDAVGGSGTDSTATERLTVRLRDGRYALVVRGPETGTDAQIRVASSTHSLAVGRVAGSVTAPAAAPGVLSVGSLNPTGQAAAQFSSQGPTLDGRLGVHVVAPGRLSLGGVGTFEGTSASASYVGGVVALLYDAKPNLEPEQLHEIVTASADPLGGVNSRTGHGRIRPANAIEHLRNSSNAALTYGKVCSDRTQTIRQC